MPESAPGNADRETSAPFQSQTCNRAKQTLSIDNQDVNLLTYLDRQGRNEYIHLLRKLLMTVTILLSFFTKTKFDGLWRRVPLRNVNSSCCEHLALDNT